MLAGLAGCASSTGLPYPSLPGSESSQTTTMTPAEQQAAIDQLKKQAGAGSSGVPQVSSAVPSTQ